MTSNKLLQEIIDNRSSVKVICQDGILTVVGHDAPERMVAFPDKKVKVINALLEFIHNGQLPLFEHGARLFIDVGLAADEYEIHDLRRYVMAALLTRSENYMESAKIYYICSEPLFARIRKSALDTISGAIKNNEGLVAICHRCSDFVDPIFCQCGQEIVLGRGRVVGCNCDNSGHSMSLRCNRLVERGSGMRVCWGKLEIRDLLNLDSVPDSVQLEILTAIIGPMFRPN